MTVIVSKGEVIMAAAKKCDRCGVLFELKDDKYYEYGVATPGLFQPVFVDLCPNCKESLDKWYKNPGDKCQNNFGSTCHCIVVKEDKKRWWQK
jgi:hypothetical protein